MKKIENASVQYYDMKGSAALDFHGSFTELWEYAKDKGIDIEKYEPIGLDIYYGETDYFGLTFLVIDKEKADEYKMKNNERLPVIEISVEEKQADFESRFKRFHVKLNLHRDNFDGYDLIESKNISDFQDEEDN